MKLVVALVEVRFEKPLQWFSYVGQAINFLCHYIPNVECEQAEKEVSTVSSIELTITSGTRYPIQIKNFVVSQKNERNEKFYYDSKVSLPNFRYKFTIRDICFSF